MATAYPAALDTVGSQLRTDIASTDDLDDSGKEHDTQHVNVNGAVVALETKLGIGASAASAASDGDALTKQADGSTAWEAVAAGVSWSGSTANGLATYGSSSSVVAESTATYDGTTLALTTAGGGLKLDGLDSSDANTLDDYEEGTATISCTAGTGTITVNTSYDTIKYTKIGNRVFLSGQIAFSATSTPSGSVTFTGLPFTNSNTGGAVGARAWDLVTALNLTSDLDPGSTLGWMEKNSASLIVYTAGLSAPATWDASLIDTGTEFLFHGDYSTDS